MLDEEKRKFVVKMAEVRNAFVHDVRNVTSTIDAFLKSVKPPSERNGFLKAFRYFAPTETKTIDFPGHPGTNVDQFVAENLRLSIFFSAMNLIAVLYVKKELEAEKRQMEQKRHQLQAALADAVATFAAANAVRPDAVIADGATVADDMN